MGEIEARVKLFVFDTETEWSDQGIFLVGIENESIQIQDEETLELKFKFDIKSITVHRQNESIICWMDTESIKYAISFQHTQAADSFWSGLSKVQSDSHSLSVLPDPYIENIPEIVERLFNDDCLELISNTWLTSLCENIEKLGNDFKKIGEYFEIFKKLINLSRFNIFEGLLKNPHFLAVFIVIESDPDKTFTMNFCEYFENKVKFVNILAICDQVLIENINLAFRVLCLKESLMSSSFSEEAFSSLNSFYHTIWDSVINKFVSMTEPRMELMTKVISHDVNAFYFINEVVENSKFIGLGTRFALYTALKSDKTLNYMVKSWNYKSIETSVNRVIVNTYHTIASVDTKIVFDVILEENQAFIGIFKESAELDLEIFQKTCELLKELLKSDYLLKSDHFFKGFYEEILPFFLNKLLAESANRDSVEHCEEILQVFSHCILDDFVTIRFFIISKKFHNVLCELLITNHKTLKIAVIQVIKSIIIRKDHYLIGNLIRTDIIPRVLQLFSENAPKENLTFSSILSLFQAIRSTEYTRLIEYSLGLLNKDQHSLIIELLTENENEVKKNSQAKDKNKDPAAEPISQNTETETLQEPFKEAQVLGKRMSNSYQEPNKKQSIDPAVNSQ